MSEDTTYQQQTLFAEDSLAKMLALSENARDLKEKGQLYGQSSIESFAKFDQDGSLLKMSGGYFQATMEGSLQKFSEDFPSSGMMRNGELFQRREWALPIEEKGFSLWPTPLVSEAFSLKFKLVSLVKRYHTVMNGGQQMHIAYLWAMEFGNYPVPEFYEWLMGFPLSWTEIE